MNHLVGPAPAAEATTNERYPRRPVNPTWAIS